MKIVHSKKYRYAQNAKKTIAFYVINYGQFKDTFDRISQAVLNASAAGNLHYADCPEIHEELINATSEVIEKVEKTKPIYEVAASIRS